MVRIANTDDCERLTELFIGLHRRHVEINPNTFRMPEREWFSRTMAEILNDGETTVLVHDNGGINGYAVAKIIDVNAEELNTRKVCFIDCFAVAEDRRRQGIGTELFKAVTAFGREQGCTYVQLGVTACNADAIAFYEKMGLNPRTIKMEKKLEV